PSFSVCGSGLNWRLQSFPTRRSSDLSGRASYTIQTCDPSVSRTAVRWGPQFSSSAPPRSPAPPFDHFPFGPPQALSLSHASQHEDRNRTLLNSSQEWTSYAKFCMEEK